MTKKVVKDKINKNRIRVNIIKTVNKLEMKMIVNKQEMLKK